MLKTVQEAKRLWCPYCRDIKEDQDENCLADSCMAWRWAEDDPRPGLTVHEDFERFMETLSDEKRAIPLKTLEEQFLAKHAQEPSRPGWIPESWDYKVEGEPCDGDLMAYWVEPEREAKARRKGYCGLAGRPKIKE